ncbi:MAG: TolC family protein [Bacteroidia bacterium]|nr:TolC family protein [Bacteroidia bacterium]
MILRQTRFFIFLFHSLLPLVVFPQSRTLDYYLNEGICNSPLLKDLQNQLNTTSFDTLLIQAAKKPQIEAVSQLLYSPVYGKFGYDEVITDGGNYQAVAAVSQSIFNRKGIENKYKTIGIQSQSISNTAKLSVAELKKTITNQFLTCCSDFSELSFNRSFFELMQNENEIVKQFVNNGICNQTDYLSLLVETQGQEVLVNQLQNQYRKDLGLLNQLCGLNDTTLYELQVPLLDLKEVIDVSGSPFFRQFIIDSINIVNEKSAIEIRYKPKVRWFADAGVLTSTPLNFYRHFGYSAGISLNVPIYDGHQKSIEKQKLDLSENTRLLYKSNSRKQYNQQILQLNEELKGMREVKAQLERQLATSKQLTASLKAQLETGIIRMTDYINSIKNFRNINRNLNLACIQILQIINEMNYLATF